MIGDRVYPTEGPWYRELREGASVMNYDQIVADLSKKVVEDSHRVAEPLIVLAIETAGPLAGLSLVNTIVQWSSNLSASMWRQMRSADGEPGGAVTDDDRLAVALINVQYGMAKADGTKERQREIIHEVQRQFRQLTGREMRVPEYVARAMQ